MRTVELLPTRDCEAGYGPDRFPPNLGCGCFHHAPPIHGIQNAEMQKKKKKKW